MLFYLKVSINGELSAASFVGAKIKYILSCPGFMFLIYSSIDTKLSKNLLKFIHLKKN